MILICVRLCYNNFGMNYFFNGGSGMDLLRSAGSGARGMTVCGFSWGGGGGGGSGLFLGLFFLDKVYLRRKGCCDGRE